MANPFVTEMNEMCKEVHQITKDHGFSGPTLTEAADIISNYLKVHDITDDAEVANMTELFYKGLMRNKGEQIALMHSELSEALEFLRKGGMSAMDDKLPQYPGVSVEMADCVIRIMDFCAQWNIPLGEIILAKVQFNAGRPYMHGKNC